MTATLETIPEFQSDSGNFDVYHARFELFASAVDIAADKKLRVFLTPIGDKAYVFFRSLLLQNKVTQVPFHEAVAY